MGFRGLKSGVWLALIRATRIQVQASAVIAWLAIGTTLCLLTMSEAFG